MSNWAFELWADHLNALRDQDPRLDAVLDLGHLERALREPAALDVYGVATVYKARLLRRKAQTGATGGVMDGVMQLVDEVMALSTAR